MLSLDLIRPRAITAMPAVLLPMGDDGTFDWDAFDAHVDRTATAGLVPAVNMDTGYVHLLDSATKTRVLERTAARAGDAFVAGAFDLTDAVAVRERGGTPVIVPNERLPREVL